MTYQSYEEERASDERFEAHQERLAQEADERDQLRRELDVGKHTFDLYDDPGPALVGLNGDRSEDDPHPVIVRATHVHCGTTFTDPFTLEVLNDLDVRCPHCSEECEDGECRPIPCRIPYGTMVWEHRDGTLWETQANADGEVIRHQRVFTHVKVYKSWVNGAEWWIQPQPNTGDLDDDHTVGFDTYEHALAALPTITNTIVALGAPEGIAFRPRTVPIYTYAQAVTVMAQPRKERSDGTPTHP